MTKLKTTLAAALALALAVTAPTPAVANSNNLGKIVLGAGALALLAKVVHDKREAETHADKARDKRREAEAAQRKAEERRKKLAAQKRQERENRQAAAERAEAERVRKQAAARQARKQQRPVEVARIHQPDAFARNRVVPGANRYPGHIETRATLPAACERSFKVEGGKANLLPSNCLQQAGIWTTSLPMECERVLEVPGDAGLRQTWSKKCLKNNGYRIQ